jgi:hypothetical protein
MRPPPNIMCLMAGREILGRLVMLQLVVSVAELGVLR